MKRILLVIVAIAIAGMSIAILSPTNHTPSKKILVSASFYPMGFFASEIGRDKVTVFTITPAGAEPHDYEPTTQDMVTIMKSRLIILNGGGLEAWGDKVQSDVKNTGIHVVVAGLGLTNNHIVDNGQTITDPHVWLDPIRAKIEATRIADGLIAVDPTNRLYYQKNLTLLNEKLDALNSAFTTAFAQCSQKSFVTSHAAFGYLADRYHLTQVAISGVTPDEEPSSQKMAEIANLVKNDNIHYVFFESLVSPKLSDTIASETGAKTMVLDPLEGITKTEASTGANYFTIQQQNIKNLSLALACT